MVHGFRRPLKLSGMIKSRFRIAILVRSAGAAQKHLLRFQAAKSLNTCEYIVHFSREKINTLVGATWAI